MGLALPRAACVLSRHMWLVHLGLLGLIVGAAREPGFADPPVFMFFSEALSRGSEHVPRPGLLSGSSLSGEGTSLLSASVGASVHLRGLCGKQMAL